MRYQRYISFFLIVFFVLHGPVTAETPEAPVMPILSLLIRASYGQF